MVSLRGLLPVVLLWAAVVPPLAAEVEVTIDRNPVQVNESFQLVFSLEQTPTRDPDFSTLQQHFLVLGNNRSNNISIINGEYQRSVKWTLQLMAKQIGEYMIPAIRFGDERSEPFQVTVQPSSLSTLPHDQQILEMTIDRSEVYVQSQVILTMRLLSATDISAYQFGKIPAQDLDLVVEPLGDLRQYQTRIADRSYLVLEQQFALFPQQSGQLEIPPVPAEVRLTSGSSIDPFNRGGEVRRFQSQPISIDVKPIPAEFVGDYWLPADSVELLEQWPADLSKLVAGEPVTRSITLLASGLTAAQLPEIDLPVIDGIKQYPDQPVLQDNRSSKGMSAQRVQKVALIPIGPGLYRVPEISVKWWNLATGEVKTATLPARNLVVDPALDANPTPTPMEPALPADGLPAGVLDTPPTNRFWVWLSLSLGLGWAASLVYWWIGFRGNAPLVESIGETMNTSLSLSAAQRELREACERDDAAAARLALLSWGQAVMAPQSIANLGQLGSLFGEELGREIETLNQSLYAVERDTWQGRSLWALCQRLQQDASPATGASERLSTLNP